MADQSRLVTGRRIWIDESLELDKRAEKRIEWKDLVSGQEIKESVGV